MSGNISNSPPCQDPVPPPDQEVCREEPESAGPGQDGGGRPGAGAGGHPGQGVRYSLLYSVWIWEVNYCFI